MSKEFEAYIVTGIEISDALTDKWESWIHVEKSEKYLYDLKEGSVGIVRDMAKGKFVYLGYIYAMCNTFNCDKEVKCIDIDVAKDSIATIEKVLHELADEGVIDVKRFNKNTDRKMKTSLITQYY